MKLVVALVGPALLAVAIMESATFVADRSAQPQREHLVWGGRVFTSEEAFASWLAARGRSYDAWLERHPDVSWGGSAVVAEPRPLRLWSASAAVGVGAVVSGLLVLLLARRAVGATAGVARTLPVAGRPRPRVREWLSSLAHGARRAAGILRAAVRTVARGTRPVGRAAGRGLVALRAAAPVEARRLGVFVRRASHALAKRIRRVRYARETRSVLAYGAIMVASGAFGVGIVLFLE